MMSYCPKCKEALEENVAFCPFCGFQIGKLEEDKDKTIERFVFLVLVLVQ